VIQHVPSEKNLADEPSRHRRNDAFTFCYEKCRDLDLTEIARFYEKPPRSIKSGMTTIIFNYLQSNKKKAYMVKRYADIIESQLGWFLNKPSKRWTVAAAIAEYLDIFKSYKPKPIESILEKGFGLSKEEAKTIAMKRGRPLKQWVKHEA